MTRWRCGCDGMISVNSIFASFAGGLVAVVVALTERSPLIQLCVFMLVVAFLLFAHAAELITDAVEANDVLLYQQSHARYDLGVILMLSASLLLWALGYRYAALIPFAGAVRPWLRDCIWLVRKPRAEWEAYLQEITSEDK